MRACVRACVRGCTDCAELMAYPGVGHCDIHTDVLHSRELPHTHIHTRKAPYISSARASHAHLLSYGGRSLAGAAKNVQDFPAALTAAILQREGPADCALLCRMAHAAPSNEHGYSTYFPSFPERRDGPGAARASAPSPPRGHHQPHCCTLRAQVRPAQRRLRQASQEYVESIAILKPSVVPPAQQVTRTP